MNKEELIPPVTARLWLFNHIRLLKEGSTQCKMGAVHRDIILLLLTKYYFCFKISKESLQTVDAGLERRMHFHFQVFFVLYFETSVSRLCAKLVL